MSKLFLIDAYALIYRSYYALINSPRINSKGMNTSAVMGFCNTLNEVLRKEQPTHLAVAFDHGKTFRHEAFADYKAQREATPEDIRRSIPVIKDILAAWHIPIMQVDGFEADDVIGTVAGIGEQVGMDVYMLTPDKDYAQLVTDHIKMYRPRHGGGYDVMGPKEVCEKYGLDSTEQVIDMLALMGDSADNYAGCPGVGEKTAVKLIKQFGNVEGLLSRTAELKGKMREKVEGAVEDIKLSKFLAAIRTDVPVTTPLDDMKVQQPDEEKLKSIFDELEFRNFAEKLFGKPAEAAKSGNSGKAKQKQKDVNRQLDLFADFAPDGTGDSLFGAETAEEETAANVQVIDSMQSLAAFSEQSATASQFGLSVKGAKNALFDASETANPAIGAKLEEVAVALTAEEVHTISFANSEDRDQRLDFLRTLVGNKDATMVAQNAKYIIEVLRNEGIDVRCRVWDTMVAHYLVNPDLHHNKEYVNQPYSPTLACHALSQRPIIEKQLADSEMLQLFEEVEMPLVAVLAEMELNGIALDTAALRDVQNELEGRTATLEKEIYDLAGEQFNIASPKQVGEILFGKMQIVDKPKKTKTGQYVTSEEVLQQLKAQAPIVGKILDYRGLKKLLGTYVEALPRLVNKTTGHIHTTFNQCVTATGRLSSSDPNLQNIPVRTDEGKEIRRCFVADEGCEFFSCDYSQVELRIMASLSGDRNMIDAFLAGHDIHAATSAKIYHKDITDVTKDERRKAKSANFGIIYGISAFGLAQGLEIDRREAKDLIDGYFRSFPDVEKYIEKCKETARQKGYAETLLHRRRYLPDINSKNGTVRSFAERNAVNAPIQGTAADIMKVAMVRIHQRMKAEGLRSKLLLQVHDELNFSVVPSEHERLQLLVQEEMQHACALAVPLLAEGGWGTNWLEAH